MEKERNLTVRRLMSWLKKQDPKAAIQVWGTINDDGSGSINVEGDMGNGIRTY